MSEQRYQIVQSGQPTPQQMLAQPLVAPQAAAEAGASIDIAGILDAFRRRWWLPVGLAAIGAILAVFYLMRTPEVYESTATVEVAQGRLKMLNIEELKPEDLGDLEVLRTIEQNFSSGSLVLRVIDACGLRELPDFQKPDGSAYTDAQLAIIVGGMLSVELRRGTRLIDVRVQDTEPDRARLIAKTVVEQYDRWKIEDGQTLAADAQGSLSQEAEKLKTKLKESEAALLAYREEHRAVALEGKETILEDKAKAVNAELGKTKAERMRMEADLAVLGEGVDLSAEVAMSLPSVAIRPEIIALRGKVTEKETEFAMLKKRYKHKHPTYIKTESELSELRIGLDREARLAAAGFRNTRDALRDKESKLEAELRDGRGELLELSGVLVPYKSMVRDVEADRQMYESVRKRQKETAASGAVERSAITLKDEPLASGWAVWPNKKLIFLLGLMAGLGAGCALVLAGELFDRSFRSEAQAERMLAMPMLAGLPAGETAYRPRGTDDESFRTLRTSLSFVGKGNHARSFLFASADGGDAAPACAANVAAAFARQGQRTLLVDGNLHEPVLDRMVTGKPVGTGLAQYLSGGGDPGEVVSPTPVENLFLLGAGAVAPNAGELLASERLEGLLTEATGWFHKIVINAAPLDVASDGLLLARHADSVCLVVEAGKTPRKEVLRACGLLSMAGAPPVGFVLKGGRGNKKRGPGGKRSLFGKREPVLQGA